MTRPEPTIYGNCDSWDFIVGRKPRGNTPMWSLASPLQVHDSIFIHSLFTISLAIDRDNLWASCGTICTTLYGYQIAWKKPVHMSESMDLHVIL